MLNDVVVDIFEVFFFFAKAKKRGDELEVVTFSHVRHNQNAFAQCIVSKALEMWSKMIKKKI